MLKSGTLEELDRTTLRQQSLAALRSAITGGEIPPGTRLVETELSGALGVSRGTLREALRYLQQEGLIVADARGRLWTRVLNSREIGDIFAVRTALECLAVETLCASPERGEAVRELHLRLETLRAAEGDLQSQAEADLELHVTMCQLTGNEILVDSWRHLSGQIRTTMYNTGQDVLHGMSWTRHQPIIDAIASGDAAAARRVVTIHLKEAADRVVAARANGVSRDGHSTPQPRSRTATPQP